MQVQEQIWPPNVIVKWTHYWKDDEREEMEDKVQTVLSYFPELDGRTITIGRTKRAGVNGVHPRDNMKKYRHYIRLKPGCDKLTISHEICHSITQEKMIDILAMARSPVLIDKPPSYLDIPKPAEKNPEIYADTLHDVAVDAVDRFNKNKEAIAWFESQIKKEVEEYETA